MPDILTEVGVMRYIHLLAAQNIVLDMTMRRVKDAKLLLQRREHLAKVSSVASDLLCL